MPLIDIDPSLTATDDYLRSYARDAKSIHGRTVPPEARARSDWTNRTQVSATETFLAASFGDESFDLGHTNFVEYLCQIYATHGVYVITPDIIWHTILCEIAAEIRSAPKSYARLFTTTPEEKQKIIVVAGAVEELPLGALIDELRARVPTDADWYLPTFSTTDPMALWARFAAFADICSPYYSYGTMLCGYRGVDVRGTLEDYQHILDHVAHLALEFAVGGDTTLSFWLSGRVQPLLNRFVRALQAQDGAFFGAILTTQRCGSGGEIEIDGWWSREMLVKPVNGQKPDNAPSHIARVIWKNLETGRRFSINFGLFFSRLDGEILVPQWGYVQNEIFDERKAEPIPDNEPLFTLKTVRVGEGPRKLNDRYLGPSS